MISGKITHRDPLEAVLLDNEVEPRFDRIVVESAATAVDGTRDCYRLVSRIHNEFEVLEQEYNDYIATPKPNGYQSIHTTVVSSCGFPVEIQIRTQGMHLLAERGSASHMQYKKERVLWMSVPPLPNVPSLAEVVVDPATTVVSAQKSRN